MLLLGFLLSATGLNLALGFLVQFKTYRPTLRIVLLGLSGLFTAYLWVGYSAVFAPTPESWFQLGRILLLIGLAASLGLLELTRHFLRGGGENREWIWGRWRVSLFTLIGVGVAASGVILFLPGQVTLGPEPVEPSLRFHGFGMLVPTLVVLMAIYSLYLLESTYRFAEDYQRRIGRLCFIGLGAMSLFQIVYFARALLYREVPSHFAEASSVIYGVVYPVVLAGFLRYRLGIELISIPRGTVYTSATMFMTGAAFLGVALTVFAFQWLRIDFTYFERFLVAFSLGFLAVLVLGSGTMRRRISRFVDQQLYSRKYDYQEQFFRLHKTTLSGVDLDSALVELVENMKYSVTVDDAYFFLLNWQDGNFYQHENKEEATRRGLVISGDSPLARSLAGRGAPLDLLDNREETRSQRQEVRSEPLVESLGLDAVFPIFIGERLAAILGLQGGRRRSFDREDLDLIAVFTNSIGDAIFKSQVLKERIERKQFESFHHVASFIIHDIKNQIATLNLLLKNAEKNLGNPSFQASMLNSVKSCAVNLQGLIDKLSVAPKRHEMSLASHPLAPLMEEVVSNSGLASLPGLSLEIRGSEGDPVSMDRQALFFVVRNLVNNALEAMGNRGRLALSFGPLEVGAVSRLRDLFGGGEQFFAGFGAYVTVEDEGGGMEPDFVRRRLFQPFVTTKEKGVGIGLYQCKTLVEGMGGRIMCHSLPGKGSEFCILLPK